MSETVKKSPISVLDEFCKRKLQPPAEYTISSENTSEFICTVTSFNETKTSKATSKKKAKHAAAQDLIKHLRNMESFKFDSAFLSDSIINLVGDTEVSSSTTNGKKRKNTSESDPDINYIGHLLEFCTKHKLPPPSFESIENTPEFLMKCWVNDIERQGKGSSKKQAKKEAAKDVLNVLMERQLESKSLSETGEPSPKRLKGADELTLPKCNEAAKTAPSDNNTPAPQIQYEEDYKINLFDTCDSLDPSDEGDSLDQISCDDCDNEDITISTEMFSPLQSESNSEEEFDNNSSQGTDYDEF